MKGQGHGQSEPGPESGTAQSAGPAAAKRPAESATAEPATAKAAAKRK